MKTSVKKLKEHYAAANLKQLAIELPHLRDSKDSFVQFLMDSNLLRMQEHLNDAPITFGADPEFILCDKNDESKIIMFSSEYTTDHFGISEAEVGADYGLLEFRPKPTKKITDLVTSIAGLHKDFLETYDDFKILEKEAIEYNHKRARVLESLDKEKDINYGMHRGKDVGVWAGGGEITLGIETGLTLSAYSKPTFNQFNDKLLTAGGHIHIGGRLIMMLSMDQLKALIRKFDTVVLPICKKVETKFGKLRREVYGSPGEFRLKNYGIEYRSPSNAIFWQDNLKVLQEVLEKIDSLVRKATIKY